VKAVRAGLLLAGLSAITTAVVGALGDPGLDLPGVVSFLLAVLVGHELVVLPVAMGVGTLVSRRLGGPSRRWVLGGLYASAVLTAISLPSLVGSGRIADNPSRLPLDYPRNLLIVLGVVWAVVGVGCVLAVALQRRRRHRSMDMKA
jgi:hypothetical protein